RLFVNVRRLDVLFRRLVEVRLAGGIESLVDFPWPRIARVRGPPVGLIVRDVTGRRVTPEGRVRPHGIGVRLQVGRRSPRATAIGFCRRLRTRWLRAGAGSLFLLLCGVSALMLLTHRSPPSTVSRFFEVPGNASKTTVPPVDSHVVTPGPSAR